MRGLIVAVLTGTVVGAALIVAGSRRDVESPAAGSSPSPASIVASASRPAPPPRTDTVTLGRGDSLARALARRGIDDRTGAGIAAAFRKSGVNLRHLKPEDSLEIAWGLDGAPVTVVYQANPWLDVVVTAGDGGWTAARSETRPRVRVDAVAGQVQRSLFHAIEEAGESPRLVVDMVEIFASDFDFTADARPGDRFRILVEKRYADQTFVDYGRIVAAQYVSDGRILTGIGFAPGRTGRFGYYDVDGRSLRKSFLRSPLQFTRITSGFTYARPHPILGGVRPHLAVDYAAPVGTPVRAVADGVVLRAGRAGRNGISVTVGHRGGYRTMYNHLSRLSPRTRPQVRVRQREVIGYVGSTGLSTGPHLDYRVSYRGRLVDPLKEQFIPGDTIPAGRRSAFRRQARALVGRLEAQAPF